MCSIYLINYHNSTLYKKADTYYANIKHNELRSENHLTEPTVVDHVVLQRRCFQKLMRR